jgi:hypothetical protein
MPAAHGQVRVPSIRFSSPLSRSQHRTPLFFFFCCYIGEDVKAVELVQQLHQRALDLAVRRRALREAAAANGINLVHEDDAGLVVARIAWQKTKQKQKQKNTETKKQTKKTE